MILRAVAVGVASLLATACLKNGNLAAMPLDVAVGSVRAGDTEISSPSSEDPSAPSWSSKDEIEVEWRGRWWPATVMERRGGGRFLVHYTGYSDEWNEVVGVERIRERGAIERAETNEPVEVDADP